MKKNSKIGSIGVDKSLYEGMRFVETLLGEAHSSHVETLKKVIRENRDSGRACYDQMWNLGCGTKYPLIREYMGYESEEELLRNDEVITNDGVIGEAPANDNAPDFTPDSGGTPDGSGTPDMSHGGNLQDFKIILMKKDAQGQWVTVGDFHMRDNPENIMKFAPAYAKEKRVGVKVEPQPQTEDVVLDETMEFGDADINALGTKGSWVAKAGDSVIRKVSGISLREFLENYDLDIRGQMDALADFRGEKITPLVTVYQEGNSVPILIYSVAKRPSRIVTNNLEALTPLEEQKAPRHWAYKDGDRIYTAEFDESHGDDHIRETIEALRGYSPKAFTSRGEMHEELKSW